MSGEIREIVTRQAGFTWKLNVKKTTRTPKEGSKYDDVTEAEAGLSGNTEAFAAAEAALDTALERIKEILSRV